MTAILIAAALTLGVSFLASLLESILLSTTAADIEGLKKSAPDAGRALDRHKTETRESLTALIALHTIAITVGCTVIGGLATEHFGEWWLGGVAAALTIATLIVAEIVPKNFGAAYRLSLQPTAAGLISIVRVLLFPITWLCNRSARMIAPDQEADEPDTSEEIILLAERSAKEGKLTPAESKMIAAALTLDDIRVSEIMTPRTVVTALDATATVAEVFAQHKNIPFARIPVFQDDLDRVVGLVRRRDLLKAKANDQDGELVGSIKQEVHFIPETVSGAAALQMCLKTHQQLLVVVDEFGSVAGVVTMEDIMEHIIGREIFEKDDLAVDMRELARSRGLKAGTSHGRGVATKAPARR